MDFYTQSFTNCSRSYKSSKPEVKRLVDSQSNEKTIGIPMEKTSTKPHSAVQYEPYMRNSEIYLLEVCFVGAQTTTVVYTCSLT